MTPATLRQYRLQSQRLTATDFEDPAGPVRWLGAVQAQDYLGSLWAIGLRFRNATETIVERAIAERTIVRTWPMRGTLHFVAAEDVRWMLELMATRVAAANAGRLAREYGLDAKVLGRSGELVARTLEGGRRLTRGALYQALEGARISTTGGRGLQIVTRLAHDGLICYGPREGKQPTLVLLDEWIPRAKRMDREAALAELARRYFTSHGPATVHDFAWWTGLRIAEAAEGVAMVSAGLVSFQVEARTYWAAPATPATDPRPRAFLLPPFDEYTVAYRDRRALVDSAYAGDRSAMELLQPAIAVNGLVVGTWARTLSQGSVRIDLVPSAPVGKTAHLAVRAAARRHAAFLGLSVHLS